MFGHLPLNCKALQADFTLVVNACCIKVIETSFVRAQAALLHPLQPRLCGQSRALTHVCVQTLHTLSWEAAMDCAGSTRESGTVSSLRGLAIAASGCVSEPCWKASDVLVNVRSEHPS